MNRFAGGPWNIGEEPPVIIDSAPQRIVTVRRIFSDGPAPKTQARFRYFGDGPFPLPRLPGLAGTY